MMKPELKNIRIVLAAALLMATGAAVAAPGAAAAHTINVEMPTYDFTYRYPAAAARIPALKAWLDKDAAGQQAKLAGWAREGAEDQDATAHKYYDNIEWLVVADLPDWLSLSGTDGNYTGGAHPNHGPIALLWDKTQNRPVKAVDLFQSWAALTAAIRTPFCAALNRQRAERRGEAIDPRSQAPYDRCPDPAERVVILGSTDHTHFTRIGILMGPYVAGPYTDGDYEVTLPVTPAVISALRPEYRGAFALGSASAKARLP